MHVGRLQGGLSEHVRDTCRDCRAACRARARSAGLMARSRSSSASPSRSEGWQAPGANQGAGDRVGRRSRHHATPDGSEDTPSARSGQSLKHSTQGLFASLRVNGFGQRDCHHAAFGFRIRLDQPPRPPWADVGLGCARVACAGAASGAGGANVSRNRRPASNSPATSPSRFPGGCGGGELLGRGPVAGGPGVLETYNSCLRWLRRG